MVSRFLRQVGTNALRIPVYLFVEVGFKLRNPAIRIAFGCGHSEFDLVSTVTLSQNVKGVKFKQFGNLIGE